MAATNAKPPDPKSYREAVSKNWLDKFEVAFPSSCQSKLSSFKGEPALLLTDDEEDQLALPFQFTLVGKFSKGRPSMEILRKEILAASFTGECYLGLYDHKHVFFKFEMETDFHRMWMRRKWVFNGFPARIFRWSKEFNPEIESSIAPVWIKFPHLPLHMFDKDKLFSIASAAGSPLKVDRATAAASKILRPNETRVCVELDVLKEIPKRIWIGSRDKGRWQMVEVEDLPPFCIDCQKMGHSNGQCNLTAKTQLLSQNRRPEMQKEKPARKWVPIENSNNNVQRQPVVEDTTSENVQIVKETLVQGGAPIVAQTGVSEPTTELVAPIEDPSVVMPGDISGTVATQMSELMNSKSGNTQRLEDCLVGDINVSTNPQKNKMETTVKDQPTKEMNSDPDCFSKPTNAPSDMEEVVFHVNSRNQSSALDKVGTKSNNIIDCSREPSISAESISGCASKCCKVTSDSELPSSQITSQQIQEEIDDGQGSGSLFELTGAAEESTWEFTNLRIAKDPIISVEGDWSVPHTLPRTESAPLLRIHWLDKDKPKPGLHDMDAHGKLPKLDDDQEDNILVQVHFEEQGMGKELQSETPAKTSRYNLRSLSKEEICDIQSTRKNKKKEARRNALEFSYSDSDTHFDID